MERALILDMKFHLYGTPLHPSASFSILSLTLLLHPSASMSSTEEDLELTYPPPDHSTGAKEARRLQLLSHSMNSDDSWTPPSPFLSVVRQEPSAVTATMEAKYWRRIEGFQDLPSELRLEVRCQ